MKKPTEAEIEAISASWAWRLTRPVYRIEREIKRWRWQRLMTKLRPRFFGEPATQDPAVSRPRSNANLAPRAEDPDDFVLYRILGNDLPPRHRKGQTRTNLALILAHEPALENCQKRWIVNRIIDPAEEAVIIELLERSGQLYTRIPFDLDEYAGIGWETGGFSEPGFFLSKTFEAMQPEGRVNADVHARRLKNIYAMNNNGGRNAALEAGRSVAKWVLPWDGNCFLTESGWREIRQAVKQQAHLKYFVVPMLRVSSNEVLLQGGKESAAEDEPQLIFRRDAAEMFDEARPYGTRPKVDLIMRLGIPGPWDKWRAEPWEAPMAGLALEAGQFANAGWVGRLESGQPHLEQRGSSGMRTLARADAIVSMLDELDRQALSSRLRPDTLCHYDGTRVAGLAQEAPEDLRSALKVDAEAALARGPYSVAHKSGVAPSGSANDYLSLARYWWPNPASRDGLPYVNRDGDDVFRSGLAEFASDRSDRIRLQHLFDDSIVLALAWATLGEQRYIDHAVKLVRTWFIEPQTRMTPHLRFAQLVRGHESHVHGGAGILDFAGLPRLLDAVRLMEQAGALDERDRLAFRHWLRSYSDWLQDSPQGRHAARALNNHGTFYDLQTASIAIFLGDAAALNAILRRARERLPHQFDEHGAQPRELARTRPRHYSHYNLVAWISLAQAAESVGDDLWNYKTADGRGLERGLRWLLDRFEKQDWPPGLAVETDRPPLAPLRAVYRAKFELSAGRDEGWEALAPFRVDPMSGIPPYWSLLR